MANYSLTVYYGGNSYGSNNQSTGAPEGRKKKSAGKSQAEKNLSQAKKLLGTAAMVGYAKDALATYYNYRVNTTNIRYGSQALEDRYRMWQTNITRSVNAGLGLVMGIVTGTPVLAIGAIAGSAISAGVEYVQRSNQLQLERSVENVSIGMADIRSGVGGGRFGKEIS